MEIKISKCDTVNKNNLQKSKAIQHMIAQIIDEANQNNLTLGQTVELAIERGMEYQENVDKAFRQFQGACIAGKKDWVGAVFMIQKNRH